MEFYSPAVALESSYTLPTDWNLGNTVLGCGTRVLQGWSTGIGIKGNDTEFERKLARLIFFSISDNFKYLKTKPAGFIDFYTMSNGTALPAGSDLAPSISVGARRHYILSTQKQTIIMSHEDWIERFIKFVKDNDLGFISRTESTPNPSYHKDKVCIAMWAWNGKVPDMTKFFKDWNPSDTSISGKTIKAA